MTIPASRRDELRRLAGDVHQRNASLKFGDPRYSCVVGSDELLALVTAVPDLLDEIERLEAEASKWYKAAADGIDSALEHGVHETERLLTELGEAKLVIEQQDRDLERLRETNEQAAKAFAVVDDLCAQAKDRIVALETALGEALTMWGNETGVHTLGMVDDYDRLRKVLG